MPETPFYWFHHDDPVPPATAAGNGIPDLIDRMLCGDRRALARLITAMETAGPSSRVILQEIFQSTGGSHVIGITGPPGAGKSTLAWSLARAYRARSQTVGVVAIDPTSPRTGGALLGDRIRMDGEPDPGMFFRSMANRGFLGGTARAARGVVQLLDAFGKDVVLLETVGAGQADVAVRDVAHTAVVVAVPGLGDDIQALKAGILEIADVLVVNKADREGADRVVTELEGMLALGRDTAVQDASNEHSWTPPVLKVSSLHQQGVDQLVSSLDSHRDHLESSGDWEDRVRRHSAAELEEMVISRLRYDLHDHEAPGRRGWTSLVQAVAEREIDPYAAVDELLAHLHRG